MKRDGKTYCDSPTHVDDEDRCIDPADPSRVNYGKVDYHGRCYLAHLRKHKAAVQEERRTS